MPVYSNPPSRTCPSREEILAEVKRIVAEQTGLAPERIRETDDLTNDLGCDSLDVTEIAIEAEDHFAINIPDDVAERSRTVGDVVDGVLHLLGQPASATA
jgi:acyl carrier protein